MLAFSCVFDTILVKMYYNYNKGDDYDPTG